VPCKGLCSVPALACAKQHATSETNANHAPARSLREVTTQDVQRLVSRKRDNGFEVTHSAATW